MEACLSKSKNAVGMENLVNTEGLRFQDCNGFELSQNNYMSIGQNSLHPVMDAGRGGVAS